MPKPKCESSATVYSDPRINLMKVQLGSLLELIEFEKDGRTVKVDGFRLKRLKDWTLPLNVSCLESLGSPSTYCNLDCVFCYEKGNPKRKTGWSVKSPLLSVNETRARLRNYSRQEGRVLAPIAAAVREPFLNRDYLKILKMVRVKMPQDYFYLISNGSFLTEENVAKLAKLMPLEILVSLNTANPKLRAKFMRDPNPEVAIKGIPLLRRYKVPFVGGIVAWPEFTIDDLENTIRFLDANEALKIKIHLAGRTRYFPLKKNIDFELHYEEVINLVKKLRKQIRTPIVFSMELYAENDSVPQVLGTIRNSPAEKSGIRPEDVIVKIGSRLVSTQYEARFHLKRLRGSAIELQICRDGNILHLIVNPSTKFKYPFNKSVYANHPFSGVVVAEGLNPLDLRKIEKIVGDSGAKKVLVLSSKVMKPLFEEQLCKFYDIGDCKFFIEVPEHRFWGGNIMVGDLYVVSDFVRHIDSFIEREGLKPDIVIIPSTPFSLWGHDLNGTHFSDIERLTGAKVELLRTARIMGE